MDNLPDIVASGSTTGLQLQLTHEAMEKVIYLTAQQNIRTCNEKLILNEIINCLRITESNSTSGLNPKLVSLAWKNHEIFFEKLASANLYESHERRVPVFRQLTTMLALLEKPIRKFDFKCKAFNLDYRSTFLKAALHKLAKNSYWSIKSLTIDFNKVNTEQCFTRRRCMHEVLKLKYLTELCLPNFVFEEEDLNEMAKNLKFLTTLNCNIDAYMTCASLLDGLRRLPRLQRFIFNVLQRHMDQSHSVVHDVCEFTSRLCVKEFTSLDIIGCSSPTDLTAHEKITACHVLDEEDAATLPETSSRLLHLVVKRRMHPRQVKWHSNRANSLHVLYLDTDFDWESLLKLENIQFLYITGSSFSPAMLSRILTSFGPKLKLFSCNSRIIFYLEDLFKCCPKLETLDINTTNLLPNLPDGLIELHWTFLNRGHDYDALIQVLTAPNLEKVTIRWLDLDWSRLTCVINALNERNDVTPKLKSLTISSNSPFVSQNIKSKQVLFNLATAICTKAPNLNLIKMPSDDLDEAFTSINRRRYLFD